MPRLGLAEPLVMLATVVQWLVLSIVTGVEMLAIGRIPHDFLFPGIVAGVTAFEVGKALGVPSPGPSHRLRRRFHRAAVLEEAEPGDLSWGDATTSGCPERGALGQRA
jgi:hypothetical protein